MMDPLVVNPALITPHTSSRLCRAGIIGLALCATILAGCGEEELPDVDSTQVTPDSVGAHMAALPQNIEQPQGQIAALGKLLFWDPVLSGNQDVACATCHHPSLGYADGRFASQGVGAIGLGVHRQGGAQLPRNSQGLINVVFNGIGLDGQFDPQTAPMFWDNREVSLEEQAIEPILLAAEMRGERVSEEEIAPLILNRLMGNPEYVALFEAAFGADGAHGDDTVSVERVINALSDFQRTLVATNSPFDRFMRGERGAMNEGQIVGMQNFIDAGCADCHNGPMFSDYQLHVLSAPDHPDNPMTPDTGADGTFAFRTPTLRNLAMTAPYMHSGAIADLGLVMDFYEDLEEGRSRHPSVPVDQLDPLVASVRGIEDGKTHILAFLDALNDGNVDVEIPSRVPSGLPVGGSIN